jgi:hypothetical protein
MRYMLIIFLIIGCWILTCSEPVKVVRHAPEIKSLTADKTIVYVNEFITLQANVVDEDKEDELSFEWSTTAGNLINTKNNPTQWQAPPTAQTVTISLMVSDGYFETSKTLDIVVKAR